MGNSEFASSGYTVGQLNAMVKLLIKQGGEEGPIRFLRGEIKVTKLDEPNGCLDLPVTILREMKKSGGLNFSIYSLITEPEEISPPFLHVPSVEMRYNMHIRSKQGRKERKKIILAYRESEQQREIVGRVQGDPWFQPPSQYKYTWHYKIVSRWVLVLVYRILGLFSKTMK